MRTYINHMVLQELKQSIPSLERLAQKFEAAENSELAAKFRDLVEELRGCMAAIERPPLELVR